MHVSTHLCLCVLTFMWVNTIMCVYSVTCLASTLVSTYICYCIHLTQSLACALCQPVLIASTSDKKYRFGVLFEVLTEQVGLDVHACMHAMRECCFMFIVPIVDVYLQDRPLDSYADYLKKYGRTYG